MAHRVVFAFDFISPYAYLGWKRAQRELTDPDITLVPRPVLFAALLNANRTKGPAEIDAKRLYTWKHVVRLAHEQRVPIRPPPAHPFNPLLPLRVVTAIDEGADRFRVVDALFDAAWERGEDIVAAESVARCLDAAGLDGAALVEAANSDAAKADLKAATDWALGAGVFGVPSYVVGDEVFWGQDSVPHLRAFLRGDDPAAGALDAWRDLPAGAQRRQPE